ncbi:hypothetical protein J1605_000526, partial [Eschrichtius robustus]
NLQGFPGGAVVKNPPANAGNTGSSPSPGRSRMPRSNKAHVPQLLSLRSRAYKSQLLSPYATTTEAYQCIKKQFKNLIEVWASLVAQWLRICLLMQGMQVRALVWEDPTCHGATGPVSHNY